MKPWGLLLALSLAAGSAQAVERPFGLGVMLGEPTGISMKLWMDSRVGVDAGVAWSFTDDPALHLHGDLLHHAFDLLSLESGELPVYYGIGGRIKLEEDDSRAGVRIPVGIAFLPPDRRVDLFMEFAPMLDLAPETEFEMNASVGARYFF